MLLTTTSQISGKEITDYKGIVNGEVILGANVFRDIMASIRDFIGGRSAAYEEVLKKAKEEALQELQQEAKKLGANAIIGIDIDYEMIGTGMLMVAVSGTAVVIKE
ncbi:MAG: YbjQ family protein [Minisyncoccia bacterium]